MVINKWHFSPKVTPFTYNTCTGPNLRKLRGGGAV